MKTIRATNLHLARDMNSGNTYTARKLSGVLNASYLSKMARGEMDICDFTARMVESKLDLPIGWLDRNNNLFLKLTDEQCKLLTLAMDLPRSKQLALTALLEQGANQEFHLTDSPD